ncbi:MAG TPA: hypothetical protein VGX76_22950, partial [Pirellulales bacterium]|nr:hypothetical protein [Pirellulales bacterium]
MQPALYGSRCPNEEGASAIFLVGEEKSRWCMASAVAAQMPNRTIMAREVRLKVLAAERQLSGYVVVECHPISCRRHPSQARAFG